MQYQSAENEKEILVTVTYLRLKLQNLCIPISAMSTQFDVFNLSVKLFLDN